MPMSYTDTPPRLSESEIDVLSNMYHSRTAGEAIDAIPGHWQVSLIACQEGYAFGVVIPGFPLLHRVIHENGLLPGNGETPKAAIHSFLEWLHQRIPVPGMLDKSERLETN